MIIKCYKRVEIEGTKGIAHTYCMRPTNHEKYDPKGKCDIKNTKADEEELNGNNKRTT